MFKKYEISGKDKNSSPHLSFYSSYRTEARSSKACGVAKIGNLMKNPIFQLCSNRCKNFQSWG